MFASIRAAVRLMGDRPFFGTLLKALALTVALFAGLFVLCELALSLLPTLGSPLVNRALEWLTPVLFLLGLFLLGAPVAALFGGFFLDGIAARIEARDYPLSPRAPGMTLHTGLKAGLALAGSVIGIDLALLPFDIAMPGLGELATLAANGWLLGREYFELAALRHLPPAQAAALRQRYRAPITMLGMLIAVVTMIPGLDLIAPLFGVALMVHLFHQIQRRDAP